MSSDTHTMIRIIKQTGRRTKPWNGSLEIEFRTAVYTHFVLLPKAGYACFVCISWEFDFAVLGCRQKDNKVSDTDSFRLITKTLCLTRYSHWSGVPDAGELLISFWYIINMHLCHLIIFVSFWLQCNAYIGQKYKIANLVKATLSY